MAPLDLTPIIKQYVGKWVALSDDYKAVYASADTANMAADNANQKGYSEFTLLFVEPSNLLYCG